MRLILWMAAVSIYAFASAITLPENFTANFTQKITNPKKKVINYSGKVRFSDKTLLKWKYLEPTKKEVCTNGLEVLIVDHDLEQVSNYLINKGFNLSEVLKKAKPHSKNVYVAEYEGKKYTIQVDAKGRLQSVAYFDDLENKVQIVFKNVKYGKGKLPSKTMKCNYPKDYDIIRG
ncbi:LolA-like outer membrane lipoprotein chaperone [Sulfurovum sp.]|uniref:LolA-like outer membrane lipoprotein chaperone n=1 Tax=Sulfurovum sp. TaxID=1969726 RepID=UPI0025F5DB25|nr:LolA-like outer membrane lipoprotein chaperone [Sulfurovum sp.]